VATSQGVRPDLSADSGPVRLQQGEGGADREPIQWFGFVLAWLTGSLAGFLAGYLTDSYAVLIATSVVVPLLVLHALDD
jgi:hypothetical protein